ncbi:MAG: hypothetical protein PVI90_10815 [Desulfobacteraceae bacterium]|jgi:hypothetical protein
MIIQVIVKPAENGLSRWLEWRPDKIEKNTFATAIELPKRTNLKVPA